MRKLVMHLGLLVAVGGIIAAALTSLEGEDSLWPVAWLLWAPVGYLILLRQPTNGVGWSFLAIGASWGVCFGGLAIIDTLPPGQAAVWVEMIQSVFGVLPWLLIGWPLLVFPTGRLAGMGERVVLALLATYGAAAAFAFATSVAPMEETGLPSPLAWSAIQGVTTWLTSDESLIGLLVLLLASIVLLIRRWRRSTGIERLQYRWLALGATFFVAFTAIGQFLPEDSPFDVLWLAAASAIPLAIGIAVLRYRLFEIDRLISRTLSYSLVVALMAALFFGMVTAVTGPVETESDLAIAASTLAVAALFNPVRRRVHTSVDRRFNRAHYDAERVMDRFAGSLRDRVDGDEVVGGWMGVVTETMQPAFVGVWVRG